MISAFPGSSAYAAGILVADKIVQIDEHSFHRADKFAADIRAQSPGTRVKLIVKRSPDQRRQSLTLTLANLWQDVDKPDPSLMPVSIRTNHSYAREGAKATSRHKLDLYVHCRPGPVSALLWIHDGGWSFGSKASERALALRFMTPVVALESRPSGRYSSGS